VPSQSIGEQLVFLCYSMAGFRCAFICARAPLRQGGGGACVLRPTSRAATAACQRRWHQHLGATPASRRPRMGPAPAGAAAALQLPGVVRRMERPDGGMAGGPGTRAQAPFAVATGPARGSGI